MLSGVVKSLGNLLTTTMPMPVLGASPSCRKQYLKSATRCSTQSTITAQETVQALPLLHSAS